nr:immunoglobulin heavy chain junction region [Mus musculus]MBK4189431.1 immunoglobulin heavy chain junction region [Mus musculus]MBK4189432.1 immunoglobulin heavy chain junction region [Mus musculus]MBK4189433.1 immunoglobulin heavy chain junction region [Mus musculus]
CARSGTAQARGDWFAYW